MTHTILIVDDEESIRTSLRGILEDDDYNVLEAEAGEEALEVLSKEDVSVVLLDIWMDGIDGIDTLRLIKQPAKDSGKKVPYADVPVIMMSGHGTIDTAVSATKIGAYDFLEKPLSLDRVLLLLERAIRELQLVRENRELKARIDTSNEMVGETPLMRALSEQIKRVAPTLSSVLITGESGAGKEVTARCIHRHSDRADGPFVAINSAAIAESMIESELFGHEEGAVGSGGKARVGRFEQANGGTLFFDEIGDMSLAVQSKILRILQERHFERVGGSERIEVDVRVLAASNRNLKEAISEERFRKALYYRLNVVPIVVPPLRERPDDIPRLVDYFVRQSAGSGTPRAFSFEALARLKGYPWPGNVRELKNLVERLQIMASGPTIEPSDLPDFIVPAPPQEDGSPWNELMASKGIREARESFERAFLTMHLERNNRNISRTAEAIGMERSALHRKLKALGIT
ncbi:MAG: sigma-54-dependent Fis family transcriptional regulator [Magnetococcales bacterium]|nr:sigma-54-dependent Fis family transcriptional regulator [Magnetococcales bacterium]